MHTRYIDGLVVVTPNGRLDEATRGLLPLASAKTWSRADANQHVLVAYTREPRIPLGIARLRRHGPRAEITCIAKGTTNPDSGSILVRELEALARAAGIGDRTTVLFLREVNGDSNLTPKFSRPRLTIVRPGLRRVVDVAKRGRGRCKPAVRLLTKSHRVSQRWRGRAQGD